MRLKIEAVEYPPIPTMCLLTVRGQKALVPRSTVNEHDMTADIDHISYDRLRGGSVRIEGTDVWFMVDDKDLVV